MTQGDVFAAIAVTLLIFLTAWATTVALALVCPNPVARAQKATVEPRRLMLRGLLILVIGFFGAVCLAHPLPQLKLVGWSVTLAVLATAAVGLSGICQAAGRRIQDLDPTMGAYPAMVRGAAYVVGATLLPILGWFLFGPLLLIASLGAGTKGLLVLANRERAQEAA